MEQINFGQQGWICPKCGRVLSPNTLYCLWCCNTETITASSTKDPWVRKWDTTPIKTADTPQTEQMKTADYCDICKQDMCKDCIADATNPYCVPSHYEINYEPKDEPTTQKETQNSNLTFKKRTMRDCYKCKRYEAEGECIECHYEPKTEPQTDCTNCDQVGRCERGRAVECPMTERSE